MLALKFDGELIEGLIILAVIVGSALTGVAKSILTKINERKKAQADSEKDLMAPLPARPVAQPISRPAARPMPPRRPVRATVEAPAPTVVEFDVPASVRPLVEMLLGNTQDEEEDDAPLRRPTPARPPARPSRLAERPVPQAPPAPRAEPLRRKVEDSPRPQRIERREEAQARKVEQRIGHVETHVAPATGSTEPRKGRILDPADRGSLRRAIIWNEILGPPVALRTADSF